MEDSDIIGFQVKSLLKQLGHIDIKMAKDGNLALELLNEAKQDKTIFDLVLSDWFMPNLDGLGLLKVIRGLSDWKSIPFIMMTTNSDIKDVVKVLEAGVDGYLVKPLTLSKLEEALASVQIRNKNGQSNGQFVDTDSIHVKASETSTSSPSPLSLELVEKEPSELIEKLNTVLQGETEFLTSIINSMNDLLIVVDSDERITRVNKKVTNYLKLPTNEVCTRVLSDFLVLYSESGFFDLSLEASAEFTEVRGWFVSASNEKIPVLVSGSQLFEKGGETIGMVLCIKDVRNERRLQERVFELDKWKSIGELASGVAHEVNNPLGVIKGYIEQVAIMEKSNSLDKETKVKIFDRIINMVDRIAKIVSGLKTLSRDGVKDGFKKVVLIDCIDEAIAMYNEKLKNLEVEIQLDNSVGSREIFCQPTQVFQVVLNLMMNSFDAVANLSEKWIKVNISENDCWLEVSVTDSGSGIAENCVKQIFEPFFTTKDPNKGTGLGLSISRSIAHAHNGDLIVDSESEHTKFIFRLHKDILHMEEAA